MGLIMALCSHRFRSSLPFLRNPPHDYPISSSRVNSDVFSSSFIFQRTFARKTIQFTMENGSNDSDGSEPVKEVKEKPKKGKKKKKKSKGLRSKDEVPPLVMEAKKLRQINRLKNKLRKLEREVENLNESSGVAEEKKEAKEVEMEILSNEGIPTVQAKPVSLSSLFAVTRKNWNSTNAMMNSSRIKNNEPIVSKPKVAPRSVKEKNLKLKEDGGIQKELSPEMVALVSRWHEEGYLNSALNIFPPLKLRFTAEMFGWDHQEIAKWLSGADLKRIALFGCPSVGKKSAFAAKRLRSFFSIQEDTVCRTCTMKSSCRFVNQKTWKKVENLHLSDVMRVLTSYDLDVVPSHMEIPDEVKASISKVLKEVINLSK